MKKKLLIISFAIYMVIFFIATKTLLDRNEYGVFVTKTGYYICDERIKEYDKSSLVHFDKNADYEKMIDEDIYYFGNDGELKKDKLTLWDKENNLFSINDVSYDKDKCLVDQIKLIKL